MLDQIGQYTLHKSVSHQLPLLPPLPLSPAPPAPLGSETVKTTHVTQKYAIGII